MKTNRMLILGFCLPFLSLSHSAAWAVGPTVGATAIAGWTNPTTTASGAPLKNLAGINVWVGTQSQVYTIKYNAGLASSIPISILKLTDGQYYMVVQAYDTNGLASNLSNEVAFVLQVGNTVTTSTTPSTVKPSTTTTSTTTSTVKPSTTTTTLPTPDLQETVFIGPVSASTGAKILITDRVQNMGNFSTGSGFSVGFYLSTDNVITPSDTFLGSRSVDPLGKLALSQASTYVTVPAVAPGMYYLGGCADYTHAILESNELNNCKASRNAIAIAVGTTTTTTQPRPDLSELIVLGTKLTGGRLRITERVRNLGTTTTETGFSVGLYLSTDNVITTSDIKIGSRTSPVLPKNGISQVSTLMPIPIVPAGKYYVGACADDTNAIAESNDNNNCKVGNTITLP